MEISWSQSTPRSCPQCGAVFQAEVWLIVDIIKRSDLLKKILTGTLHDLICPTCKRILDKADVPLLIYRRGEFPPLLFSPALETTLKQDREQEASLISNLKGRLKHKWVEQGLEKVPRILLPFSLGIDRKTERVDEIGLFIEMLLGVVKRFNEPRTLMQAYLFVKKHPELLNDLTEEIYNRMISRVRGNAKAVSVYEEHRDLLLSCRENGIELAFADKMGISSEDLEVLAELATSGTVIHSAKDLKRFLAERLLEVN